ncbi:MAG: hypothetical protein LUG13_04405 [Oscillospiraceae bacterium]|nr:hypothetical protein [Oscillospiraceae bacterium]
MKSIEELQPLMLELLEAEQDGKFPARARELVGEIAEFARTTAWVQGTEEQCRAFWAEHDPTPEIVWAYILDRVANAPTILHANTSVMSHMPVLDNLLSETKRCRVCGCTEHNACDGGCAWVEDDLCSRCVGKEV